MSPDQLRTVGELRKLAISGQARAMRESRHIGLRELARAIDASPSAVSRWETGRNKPRFASALRWAAVLGITTDMQEPRPGCDPDGVNGSTA